MEGEENPGNTKAYGMMIGTQNVLEKYGRGGGGRLFSNFAHFSVVKIS